jgi:hypothetical protein
MASKRVDAKMGDTIELTKIADTSKSPIIAKALFEKVESLNGNRGRFVSSMTNNALAALELVISKTKDYATIDDPYRNFRMSESVGVSVEKGILVRMCDKLSRIGNLIESNDNSVKDESIEDTLIDIMNYSNILLCYIQEKRNT